MDESAQQAIQLGVNVTIFIVALSLAVTLMFGVKTLAEKAISLQKEIPEGSKVEDIVDTNKSIYYGYELIGFYSNYISNEKIGKSGLYNKEVDNSNNEVYRMYVYLKSGVDASGNVNYIEKVLNGTLPTIDGTPSTQITIDQYFRNNNIDMKKSYEMRVEEYNKANKVMKVVFKEI